MKNHTPLLPLKVFTWEYLLVSEWNFSLQLPFWRCYYNTDAGAVLSCGGKCHHLDQEHILLIPPDTPTETSCVNPFHQLYVHFSLSWNFLNLGRRAYEISPDFFPTESLAKLCQEDNVRNRNNLLSVYSFVTGAMAQLPPEILAPWTKDDARIKELLHRLEANDELLYSNAELATQMKLSENGFIRLFSESTGVPPQEYFRKKRIEKACQLLHFSEDSIDDIAIETGFLDRYHFSKVFHRVTGSWPAAFRKDKKLWRISRHS